jgi:glucose/arabinose dehydrogenase
MDVKRSAAVLALAWMLALAALRLPAAETPATHTARAEARPFLNLPPTAIFPRTGRWTTEPAFPNVTFRNPAFLEPEPGTRRLFVGELEGRIYAIDEADRATTQKHLILDLSAHTQGGWDSGLLGLAFHPEYDRPGSPNRGFIYVVYSWAQEPVVHKRPPPDFVTWTRLSRFRVDPATGRADPGSELVLINQRDRFIIHAGGGMFFHPLDGFLYVTVGDEGLAASPENVQRIDHNLFSGVLRIDVDQRGGTISHPIPREPANGETAHYSIPNDNPFVGVPNALEEFFAIGLRSPHRMTYDPVDNLAWIGEIGLTNLEEICVLEFDRAPLNFQWDLREGSLPGPGATQRRELPRSISTAPIFEFGREEGRSVIGGYVYRGERHPALRGRYVFGDFVTGKLWALSYAKGAPPKLARVELLGAMPTTNYNYRGTEGGITSFGRDHDGELFLLMHGLYSHIAQLVETTPPPSNLPPLLSETGIFANLATLTSAPRLLPYELNLPQWTDGIPARHWISVPTGKTIGLRDDGRWQLPAGTVLVQHFDVPAELAGEGKAQRLETRVLVMQPDGAAYAIGYRWRPDQSDADLVTIDSSHSFAVGTEDNPAPAPRSWSFIAPQKCAECHNAGAGYALGLKTRQLHRNVTASGGTTDSQLKIWTRLGLFDPAPSASELVQLKRLAPPEDTKEGVEHRVRSFLDVNCAHCHGAAAVRAAWDATFSTPLAEQRIIFGPLVGEQAGPGFHVVAPKDVTGSMLFRRAASRDLSERMPPLGTSQAPPTFLALLREWIEALPRHEQEPPRIVRVRMRGENVIEVVFSEAVQTGSGTRGAERAANYRLADGGDILAARLQDDLRTVTLTTSPLPSGKTHRLIAGGIADRAEPQNSLVETTTVVGK